VRRIGWILGLFLLAAAAVQAEHDPDVCYERLKGRCWRAAHCVYNGPYSCPDGDCATAFCCGRYRVWLPQDGPLYKPYAADPRQVTNSAGLRLNDQALTKKVAAVSYGDILPLVQWCNVWPFWGQLQVGIEGCLWAVFSPCEESAPLINADYFVGIPVCYAIGRWGCRVRIYHISSHIGDEFLLDHPGFDRRNPSAEYLDGSLTWYPTDEVRLYGTAGWVIQHDCSFNSGNYYLEAGAELKIPRFGFYDCCTHFYGHPFYAMHFRYNNVYDSHVDGTYVLGYEFGKACGMRKQLRFFMEYHDGYSVEGQFSSRPSNYFSLRVTYGY